MKAHDLSRTMIAAALLVSAWAPALLGPSTAQAQDNLWVNGNQLLDFNDPQGDVQVCGLPTDQDYNGAAAQYSQNAQYDENGKLLFFVVDGNIYDQAGYLMADNDADPNCHNCLMKGIQEVSITAMPGTCDKYYIILADTRMPPAPSFEMRSQVAYAILDLSKESHFHPGRKGRVWSQDDALSTPGYEELWHVGGINDYQVDAECLFLLAYGNVINDRVNNIHHAIYGGPDGLNTLLIRNFKQYLRAPIGQFGIGPVTEIYALNASMESELDFTGQMVSADGPDGNVRIACNSNSNNSPGQEGYTNVDLLTMASIGSTPAFTQLNTNIYNSNSPDSQTRGLAFSPNGQYLYFTQHISPYFGYIDMLDPDLTVHDLSTGLEPSFSGFGSGRINVGRDPSGTGYALYIPSGTGMGYWDNPDQPTSADWHPAVPAPAGSSIAAPPVSFWGTEVGPSNIPITQYLMDKQNYRDQQIPNLLQGICCLSNERIPEASHPYTFNGETTQNDPWTPQDNGLTDAVLCPPSEGGPATGHVYFDQDFVVQEGARLFVQGMEWRFGPTAKLIVEPGAFVQFDNCVLRGDICEPGRWPGVDLRGNPGLAQGGLGFPPDQGRMVFNNSTLQDAEVGVLIGWIVPLPYPPFFMLNTGGILNSTNSTFRNCRTAVMAGPYQNYLAQNGMRLRNRSRFVKTTFTVDNNFINPLDFSEHVRLWGVDGIFFHGCTFENLRSTEHNSNQLGKGITSLDANFIVKDLCLDGEIVPEGHCQQTQPSRFRGLDMGIRAATGTTNRSFIVRDAEFSDNVCGVYANSVPNFEVHNSQFNVGSSKATALDNDDELYWKWNNLWAHRGIYSYKSSGFLVDDNTLTNNPDATTDQLEGIVTGYSGAHNDVVFRNHASHLNGAYIGEGTCADAVNTSHKGLWYLCNTNADNNKGIWSRRDDSPGHASFPDQTIRLFQGSPGRPADNSFGQASGQLDIYNGNFTTGNTNNPLTYWWALPQTPYWPHYTSAGVSSSNQDYNGDYITRDPANCDSRIRPIGPVPPNPGPVELRAYLLGEAQARKAAYGNTRYLYDQLLDGGSTDETVQEIQETWPDEAWELRAMLLEKSPYLSGETIREMVKKHVMPDAMVAEICIANPDATKKEGLVKWLQYESPWPLPQYLIDNIIASWETKTYRTSLESDMAFLHSEMTQALDLALGSYQADTLGEQVDSIRATLQVLRTPSARYAEILTYLQQDNFDSAYAVMDRLPVEFKLKEKEISEKDRTKQFIGIVQNYRNNGRSEAGLAEDDLTNLRNLRDGYYDRPAEWAQNILCFGYGECRPPRSGGSGGAQALLRPVATATTAVPALRAFPNPASAWATLAYRLDETPENAYLVVRDISGKEMARIPVTQAEGQTVWDTRRVAPAAYTVELVNGGRSLGTAKLVVKP